MFVFLSCNKSALWHQLCDHMIHKYGLQCKGHFYSNKSVCRQLTSACLICSEDIEFEIEDSRGSGSSLLASTALVGASSLLLRLAPSCSMQPRPQLGWLACWFDVVLLSCKCHTDAVPHRCCALQMLCHTDVQSNVTH